MKKLLKNNKGFSYIELLTVISIIMVMSTVAIANLRGTGATSILYVSAQRVITDIRRTQTYALSAKEYEYVILAADAPTSPAGGWGIYFNKDLDHYTIFADNEEGGTGTGDHICHSDCSGSSEEVYQNIDLPNGTTIDRIYKIRTSDGAKIPATQVSIVFEPPNPTVHMCETEGDCAYDSVGVILITDTLNKREITVNFFGLVDTHETNY